jgi:hypothetical protein
MKELNQNKIVSNSQKEAYQEALKNSRKDELKLYQLMCDSPDKAFSQEDVQLYIDKERGISKASRLFRTLKDSRLIEEAGEFKGSRGTNLKHYKVINPNNPFKIIKKIELPQGVKDSRKKIIKIIDFCINSNIEYKGKGKILQMAMDLIFKLGNGQKIEEIKITNRLKDNMEFIDADMFLNKFTIFIDRWEELKDGQSTK